MEVILQNLTKTFPSRDRKTKGEVTAVSDFTFTIPDGKLIGLFNFSDEPRIAWIHEDDGLYRDLLSGNEMKASGVWVDGHGFFWMKRES